MLNGQPALIWEIKGVVGEIKGMWCVGGACCRLELGALRLTFAGWVAGMLCSEIIFDRGHVIRGTLGTSQSSRLLSLPSSYSAHHLC